MILATANDPERVRCDASETIGSILSPDDLIKHLSSLHKRLVSDKNFKFLEFSLLISPRIFLS